MAYRMVWCSPTAIASFRVLRSMNKARLSHIIFVAVIQMTCLSTDNFRWERVQRELGNGRPVFIHAYKRNRAEQRRGVSKLVSAIPLTHMAGKYDKAELEAALLNAVLAFSVESPLPNAEVGAALAPISDPSAPSSYQESMVKYREQNKLAIPGVTIRHTRLVNKSRFFRQSILMGIMPPFRRLCSEKWPQRSASVTNSFPLTGRASIIRALARY